MVVAFLNPWFLLGTLGVLVPIAVHLFNRFRPRTVRWGAMELLRRATVTRSRQVRIEDLILLILRCLAVLLIALAIARPTFTSTSAGWVGGKPKVGAVIALDASFSMEHRPGIASRFDHGLQLVHEVLKTVEPGSPVTVILMGDRPRILLRNAGYDPRLFDEALKRAKVLPERLNLELGLEEAAKLLRETKAPARECYLVTDVQAVTFENLSDKAAATLREMGKLGQVYLLPAGAEGGDNLAVTEFGVVSGDLRRGATARCTATVRNFGRQPQNRVPVSLILNDQPVYQQIIDRIEPGQIVTAQLFARFTDAGAARLVARLKSDAVTTDDARYAVAQVADRVRVLCIDGGGSKEPGQSETHFVQRAFEAASGGGAASPASLSVRTVEYSSPELGTLRLADYQVILLANVADLPSEFAAGLRNFVESGGGVMLWLGDKVDAKQFNVRWATGENALSPAELIETIRATRSGGAAAGAAGASEEEAGWPLALADQSHRLAEALRVLPPELLDEARIQRVFKVRPLPAARTILKLAGPGSGDAPLLVERQLGRGKVLLFTTTANRAWSNLPIHPVYPILLRQALTHLTRQPNEGQFAVAQSIVLPLPQHDGRPNVTIRAPDGTVASVQVSARGGQATAEIHEAPLPGFYEIQQGEGAPPLVAAVNVDAVESDVRAVDRTALAGLFKSLPVRIALDETNLGALIRQNRVGIELWWPLMFGGLVVLALEALLARWFSTRIASSKGVARERVRDPLGVRGGEKTAA